MRSCFKFGAESDFWRRLFGKENRLEGIDVASFSRSEGGENDITIVCIWKTVSQVADYHLQGWIGTPRLNRGIDLKRLSQPHPISRFAPDVPIHPR